MRAALLLSPLVALALVGCGGSETGEAADGEPLTTDEVRAEAQDLVRPEPGLYRATMEITEVEIAGLPAGQVDMIKQMLGSSAQTVEYCLAPEQAERGYEEMFRQSQDGDCTFERFEADGGTIDAAMTCQSPSGEATRLTLQGTGTETSSTMNMSVAQEIAGLGTADITMTAEHERIGDCP